MLMLASLRSDRWTASPELVDDFIGIRMEVISSSQSAPEVCRRYRQKPQLLSRWKAELIENAARVFQSDEQRTAKNRHVLLSWNGW
jgi:hypothetical protein